MALTEICGLHTYFNTSLTEEETKFDIRDGSHNFITNTVLELPPFGNVSYWLGEYYFGARWTKNNNSDY